MFLVRERNSGAARSGLRSGPICRECGSAQPAGWL